MLKIIKAHIHPKLQEAIKEMYLRHRLVFYYHFFNQTNFYEAELPVPTMCATVIDLRLAICWTNEFVESHTPAELIFVLIHELMHLVNKHLARGEGYDPKMSNISMDMLINNTIENHHAGKSKQPVCKMPILTQDRIAEIQKSADEQFQALEAIAKATGGNIKGLDKRKKAIKDLKEGDAYGVELDPNYKGELIFEPLYEWLQAQWQKEQESGNSELSEKTKAMLDSSTNGLTLDFHSEGEMTEEQREIRDQLARHAIERSKIQSEKEGRGLSAGDFDEILKFLLEEPRNNNLKLVKRSLSSLKGKNKKPSYRRTHRKIPGLKGRIKQSNEINAILDTSGSMEGEFELVLRELFRDGYVINLIQCDTVVQGNIQKITRRDELKTLKIKGLGGTVLQPGVDYILDPKNKLNKFGTVVLTDGATDSWDFHGSTSQFLILTTGNLVAYSNGPNVSQIRIEK